MSEPITPTEPTWRCVSAFGLVYMSDHLWIVDGERIVCTHCGIGLKEGVGDECPDTE